MSELRHIARNIAGFLSGGIWQIKLEDLPRRKSFFIKQLRVVVLTMRGFDQDKCFLRASALTLYTLLSIVPVVAMAFGVAKGFGMEQLLEAQLLEKFVGQEEVITRVVGFARTLLENTRGGVVAGVGVGVLLYSVIKVMGNIERTFNEIWEIKKGRPLRRKITDYFSIILIAPILIVVSGSITIFITSQAVTLTEQVAWIGAFSSVIFFVLKMVPYLLIWLLFTFVYIFVPNTKVTFKSALMAGIFAGTSYQLLQWVYITFQVGIAQYNAIYGSFAALPLFLIWLQLSWLVLLLGAEFSFASQNVDTYEFEPDCLKVSLRFKKLLSLRITHLLVKNFQDGKASLTAEHISHTLGTPVRLVRLLLFELVESGVLYDSRIDDSRELYYHVARDINQLSISYVASAMESRGVDTIPVEDTEGLREIRDAFAAFGKEVEESPANKLLKDI
ncbi:Ribonuclease BN [hydrothermal vent metagenome]|uniref:Ribonuclease BN n=1 Tax=hydrothermal vent metagenome TaxID=652676 RepID=A0A3B0R6D4_9ZZZZ